MKSCDADLFTTETSRLAWTEQKMERMGSPSITLVIKTPNQRVGDFEVSCLLDWTVEKLKAHLANVYPTKPARSSQKIIYSGKLLDDHFVLKDVLLESEGKQQTVHLVCTPTVPDSSQAPPAKPPVAQDTPPTTQATIPEVTPTHSTTQPDGVRHRHQHPFYQMYHNPATFPSYDQHQVNTNTTTAHFVPGQPYLPPNAHHGAHYTAQYMAYMQWLQHMAQMTRGVPYLPMQPPLAFSQQTVTQPQVNPPVPAAPAVQAGERQENRQENRNMAMNANAGGGMMQEEDDDDENIQRDWLDYIYMVVRIFMLMSIFWFYSSAERLILMGVTIFVVWMLQSGWFNLNRAQRNRHQDLQANAENNPEMGQEEEGEEEGEDEEEEDDDGSDSGDSGETDINISSDSNDSSQQPEHPGYLVVTYNFVTTFFTSLVPQGHRVVAQP